MPHFFALFTKVAGRWRFEGFVDDPTGVACAQFARTVEKEIQATKGSSVPTEGYKIIRME